MLSGTIAMLLLTAQAAATPPARQGRIDAAIENPDQVICRAAEPVLGSRVARRRVCKTRAEWRMFDADRAQLQRDLRDSAACRSSSTCTSD